MKKFFVNLYHKFMDLSFVEWTVNYCKAEPIMAGIIGGVALLIIILLIVACAKSSKRRKAKKAAKKAAQAATQTTTVEEPKKEEVVAEAIEPAKAEVVEEVAPAASVTKKEEPTPVEEEEKVEPVKEEPKIEPIKAEPKVAPKAEPVKEEPAPIVEEKKVEPKKAESKKAPAKKQTKAKEMEEVLAAVESAEEPEHEELATHYDEDETEKQARYKGKWTICRVLTDDESTEEMFFFELRASNGEKLLSSEEYTTYQGALRGIETHKSNILKGNLMLTLSKKGDYIFKLLSGKNMLLCMGENYPTKARCESAMESTVRFAATAVLDENVQDIIIKVPKEDESAPLPVATENSKGKWIISSKLSPEGEELFFFELFANNGEKLLSSEEYTTYTGAVNGIQTHKKNIEQNNFRISLTKRGDYIYKLLNGNGQLLCLGEHYKTKRLCQSAVDSVQRFALNSPVLTDKK